MVGYWFYKYDIDDRDIGVVDYTPIIEMEKSNFPVVSLCLKDPFLHKKLAAINITISTYRNYLEGNIYDDLLRQIEYANVTIDLGQYFQDASILWQNQTEHSNAFDTIKHVEIFNGFHSNSFVKCFMIKYIGEDQRKIKGLEVLYDSKKLETDWQSFNAASVYISCHNPGQFFLENEFIEMVCNDSFQRGRNSETKKFKAKEVSGR